MTSLLFRCGFTFLIVLASFTTVHAQLHIVQSANAQALAQKLVGDGIQISNVSLQANALATGFFVHDGGTQLNLDSGIVLSTGKVSAMSGVSNVAVNITTAFSSAANPDPDLQPLVNGGVTKDLAILEFDLVPLGDSIRFRYVFGSEEYPKFACTEYNDVFAFFLSGPGITGKNNIALVPNTTIPVSINSINRFPEDKGAGVLSTCTNIGPGSPFPEYYVRNYTPNNPYFSYNAHTRVLVATAKVQPCQTYHLKIAIADVSDPSFDSGVFIEAHSLSSNALTITNGNPTAGGKPYLTEGCHTGGITIKRPAALATEEPIHLTFAGTATVGVDVAPIPALAAIGPGASSLFIPIVPIVDGLQEGIEHLKIYLSSGNSCASNSFLDSIDIEIRDYDTLAITPQGAFCKGSSVQLQTASTFTDYQWSPTTGISNVNIYNPVVSPTDSSVWYCTATIGSCQARDSVQFFTKKIALTNKKDVNCQGAQTGEILVTGTGWAPPVQYRIDGGTYGTSNLFTGLAAGTHKVQVRDGTGCTDSISVLLAQAFPDLSFTQTVSAAACGFPTGTITPAGSGGLAPYQYSFSNGPFTTLTPFTVSGGTYDVSVKDANGCTATHPVTVGTTTPLLFSPAPQITPAGCTGNGTVTVSVTGGSGTYQYAVNNGPYGSSNVLSIAPGNATVSVKDNDGCPATVDLIMPIASDLTVDAGNDAQICEGLTTTLHVTGNASAVAWTGATVSNPGSLSPVVQPSITTMYHVTATRGACTAIDSVLVNVWSAPIPNAGADSGICVGKTIQLEGSGGIRYRWEPASLVSDASSPDPFIKPVRLTYYSLMVQDGHDCWSLRSDSVKITVVPSIRVSAGRDTFVVKGQPLQLAGRELSNSGATNYQWHPTLGLNNPQVPNPIAILTTDISYALVVSTAEGCEGTDSVNVKVFDRPDIYVPTGFTPNGDGRNDRLRPLPIGMKELRYFRLYNRWGNLVFTTTSSANGWDGRIGNKPSPTETFVWVAEGVDYTGRVVQRKGVVTLIR